MYGFYAFGKPPRNIAERVAEIAERAEEFCLEGDFSRMDGRVSNVGREFTTNLCLRLFAPEHHDEVRKLAATQVGQVGRTRFGVKFNSGTSRLSGSPETSLFNSMETLFILYLGFRNKTDAVGQYYTHTRAWQALEKGAIAGGDDSLVADLPLSSFKWAAEQLGHKVTASIRSREKRDKVTFLARYYGPEVWHGNPNSCSDIRRLLDKFHCATSLLDNEVGSCLGKLVEKARSIACTDIETPIIGPFCKKVILLGVDVKASTGDTSYYAVEEAGDRYPNRLEPWMLDLVREQMPGAQTPMFYEWLANATSLEELLRVPFIVEPVITSALPRSEPVWDSFVHTPGVPVEGDREQQLTGISPINPPKIELLPEAPVAPKREKASPPVKKSGGRGKGKGRGRGGKTRVGGKGVKAQPGAKPGRRDAPRGGSRRGRGGRGRGRQ